MVVAGMIVLAGLAGELSCCRSLRGGVQVLDLSLSKDAATRGQGRLGPCLAMMLRLRARPHGRKDRAHMYVLLLGDLYTSGLLMTKRTYDNNRWFLISTPRGRHGCSPL